jgi:hypothetical protein
LWGLLHDAAETYIGDMVKPLKVHDKFYNETEATIFAAIAKRFRLTGAEPLIIKYYDKVLLATEQRDLLNAAVLWVDTTTTEPLTAKIEPFSQPLAEKLWLARFEQLTDIQERLLKNAV